MKRAYTPSLASRIRKEKDEAYLKLYAADVARCKQRNKEIEEQRNKTQST